MSVYFSGCFQRVFGTYPLQGQGLKSAVHTAAEVGYRAFDTAQWYGNEAALGDAIRDLGVDKDELLITTKVHPENMAADRFFASVEQSLRDLQLDAVDVLLLHWPPGDRSVEPSLSLLQEAHRRGYTKHIGVSNYTSQMMRQAVKHLDVPLVINQIEFHALLDQRRLIQASGETGIPLASYCSVARGEVFNYPIFTNIGNAHGKTAAQVALRWILQQGVSINTMSTKRVNMQSNFDIMDFVLSSVDMARIQLLTETNYRISTAQVTPYAPTWDAPLD
ncbi:aldo/keto reductase [Reinekea sp.]|jgi:2,5-diketo-D-gluconate reductase B|uniref:aldo/keto reductase n=1 Tax=Reinekea sp. TaxID=1970455 RepID=UPI002A7F76C3|nr:aldo/keto reductase [Reinekea sp.]